MEQGTSERATWKRKQHSRRRSEAMDLRLSRCYPEHLPPGRLSPEAVDYTRHCRSFGVVFQHRFHASCTLLACFFILSSRLQIVPSQPLHLSRREASYRGIILYALSVCSFSLAPQATLSLQRKARNRRGTRGRMLWRASFKPSAMPLCGAVAVAPKSFPTRV